MISPQTIEAIKQRIDIIDIVGEFVKLKKRGTNYLGNCPFHNEKTPSFTVSPAKELYKCFGCGKSGNAISFIMEHEKLSYPDALKWLANRYQIEIEEKEISNEQRLQLQAADSLLIINNFAQKFFSNQLWNEQEGKAIAYTYLRERGFTDAIIQKFQLGYNPSAKNTLAQALLHNQFNRELLPKTGLVQIRNDDSLADNYRNRIIFPIHNPTGKIIGFGARVIGKADNAPKYINTPENELYVKSKVLYGAYFAKQAIDKADECLLVEGYTDVISLHQAGVENVVASGGTSLTTDQLRLIKKYSTNLTIVYDGDAAGVKAALRGLDMALDEGLNVKLVLIPDNEDPDSYVNKVGTAAFLEFIRTNKKDFILFKVEVMLKDVGNDIAKKNDLVNQVAETLSRINRPEDFMKQQEYLKRCAQLLKIDEEGLIRLVNKYKRDKLSKEEKKQQQPPKANQQLSPDELNQVFGSSETDEFYPPPPEEPIISSALAVAEKHEKNILRILLEFGHLAFNEQIKIADYILEEIKLFPFDHNQLDQLFEAYKQLYIEGKQPNLQTFVLSTNVKQRELAINITHFPYELSEKWNSVEQHKRPDDVAVHITDAILSVQFYKLFKIKRMIEENQEAMSNAAMEDFFRLLKIHEELKKLERSITEQLGTVIIK